MKLGKIFPFVMRVKKLKSTQIFRVEGCLWTVWLGKGGGEGKDMLSFKVKQA